MCVSVFFSNFVLSVLFPLLCRFVYRYGHDPRASLAFSHGLVRGLRQCSNRRFPRARVDAVKELGLLMAACWVEVTVSS